MLSRLLRFFTRLFIAVVLLFALPLSSLAQDTVEWTTLGSDWAHTRYSPAGQITDANFKDLKAGVNTLWPILLQGNGLKYRPG